MDNHSILVVDDDDDVRKMMCFVLAAEGYSAVEAHDGVEALERMAADGPPAMCVVDLMMPRMSGEELIAKMHQNPALAKTPIAIVSGRGTPAAVPGVNAVLVKPVEIGELLSVVHRLSGPTRPVSH
jgi:two-component system, chemotaxis family, sensor histidine kinase and response regulator PixL